MAKGRKPIHPHLKILSGTERPSRQREETAIFANLEEFPPPPQHLNPDGAAMWNDLGPRLMAVGVLKTVDLYCLTQLCYAWQQHIGKQKAGMDISAAEHRALNSLFSEFGMSWNARQRLSSGGKQLQNKFASNGKR